VPDFGIWPQAATPVQSDFKLAISNNSRIRAVTHLLMNGCHGIYTDEGKGKTFDLYGRKINASASW
jgi:hypothetical protein